MTCGGLFPILREAIPIVLASSATFLYDKALFIGTFPEMGQVVPGVGDPSVREIIHGSYRIIYELVHDPNAVFVLRFWHGARGTPEINEA